MPHLGIWHVVTKVPFMNKFFNDSDQITLARISNLYDVEGYVNSKEAADRPVSISDLAYPEKGLYPINTPKNTVLSYCYANEDASIPADTRGRVMASIKNAADFWGVTLPARKQEVVAKEAYAIKVSSEEGESVQNIYNDSELKEVVKYVAKNASDLSYDSRRQIAEAVLNAPANLKKQLTRDDIISMQRTAGDMFVAPSDIKIACEIRAQYADMMGHPEVAKMLKDFGGMQPKKLTKNLVLKVASILDFADRSTGMTVLYKNGKLAPPEHSLNGVAKADVELFIDKTIGMKNGSAFIKNDLVTNKDKVISFFKNYSGEDLSKVSDADIFTKIASLDEIGANAFKEITGLGVFNG